MNHCKSCLASYTQDQIQCDKCFNIGDPIIIFNCDDPCPVCFEYSDSKYVYDKCHHWICDKCHHNTTECCICKHKCETTLFKCSNHNYFDSLEPNIKNCFKQLYIKTNNTIGQELNVKANENMLYDLCTEYHKWLQLLHINDNNNNPEKLQPPKYIDQIWREHILDIPSYNAVCNATCGYVLYYYVEKNNSIKTIKLYENAFGPVPTVFWTTEISLIIMTEDLQKIPIVISSNSTISNIKEIISSKENCDINYIRLNWNGKELFDKLTIKNYGIPDNSIIYFLNTNPNYDGSPITIFVRTLQAKTLTIKILPDATIDELKEMIHLQTGIHPGAIRLIFSGKQLQDDRTIRDYKLRAGSTVHHVERLRGD